ncbi:MAG: pitrilysin family protein [Ignavibacteriaceae bacterium]
MNDFRITKLSNGTRIVSEYIPHVKSFSLGFWFNVGARDENNLNNGISHFIEHMLFKGTKRRSAKRISEEIESYGGYLNAFTSKEHTCYYTKGLPENLQRSFNVISDMIQNPLFKESHIRKEAGVILDELRDVEDNPEELIFDKFEEVIFDGNRLSMPVIGKENNIKKFNSRGLQKFHKSRYNTGKLLITASGLVDHDKLVRLAEKNIDKRKTETKTNRTRFVSHRVHDLVLDRDFNQVHTIIGRATAGFNNKQRHKLKVLSTLLGEGSSSRLFLAVREKLGITYQITSFLNSYFDVSAFGVYYSTNTKQTNRVLDIVLKEFKKLREIKIKDKELEKVKAYIKGSTLLSLENTTNRMIRMANSLLYFNRIITVEEFLEEVNAITTEDLLKIADELLDEKKLIKVILKSDESKLKKVA